MGGTVENAALNALFARAEIFNKFEELASQLNPEEAEIASHYLENLIKTRPVQAQLTCPESEQFEPGLHNMDFQEPGLHAPELSDTSSDTNCEFCAAGNPRLKDALGYYHKVGDPEKIWTGYDCEAA
jgi:hypothetical protein